MGRKLRIAIVGGGIGGLTAAIALSRKGFETHVFEQARELTEIGAGIGISPSAVKVLRALGIAQETMKRGFESKRLPGATGEPDSEHFIFICMEHECASAPPTFRFIEPTSLKSSPRPRAAKATSISTLAASQCHRPQTQPFSR